MNAVQSVPLTLLLLTACGDPLAAGTYEGDPLYNIIGRFNDVIPDESNDLPEIDVTVFWAGQGTGDGLPLTTTINYPWSHSISLYNPADDYLVSTGIGDVAVGFAVSYLDTDGSGDFTPGEAVKGFADHMYLIYAPEPVTLPTRADYDGDGGGPDEDTDTGAPEPGTGPDDELDSISIEGFFIAEVLPCRDSGVPEIHHLIVDEVHIAIETDTTDLPDLDCDGTTLEVGEWDGLCDGGCEPP